MFGFPFLTSLIVVLSGVVVASLLVNKGLTKHSNNAASLNSTHETQAIS